MALRPRASVSAKASPSQPPPPRCYSHHTSNRRTAPRSGGSQPLGRTMLTRGTIARRPHGEALGSAIGINVRRPAFCILRAYRHCGPCARLHCPLLIAYCVALPATTRLRRRLLSPHRL